MHNISTYNHVCVYVCVCLQSPSNQSFIIIAGYGMSVSDHRVA